MTTMAQWHDGFAAEWIHAPQAVFGVADCGGHPQHTERQQKMDHADPELDADHLAVVDLL